MALISYNVAKISSIDIAAEVRRIREQVGLSAVLFLQETQHLLDSVDVGGGLTWILNPGGGAAGMLLPSVVSSCVKRQVCNETCVGVLLKDKSALVSSYLVDSWKPVAEFLSSLDRCRRVCLQLRSWGATRFFWGSDAQIPVPPGIDGISGSFGLGAERGI